MRWYRARTLTHHKLVAESGHAPHTYYVRRESATSSRVVAWYLFDGWLCSAHLSPEEARAHLEVVGEAQDQETIAQVWEVAERHERRRQVAPEVVSAEETVCPRCSGTGRIRLRGRRDECFSCRGTGRAATQRFDQRREQSFDQTIGVELALDQRAPHERLDDEVVYDDGFSQEPSWDEDVYFNQDVPEGRRG